MKKFLEPFIAWDAKGQSYSLRVEIEYRDCGTEDSPGGVIEVERSIKCLDHDILAVERTERGFYVLIPNEYPCVPINVVCSTLDAP